MFAVILAILLPSSIKASNYEQEGSEKKLLAAESTHKPADQSSMVLEYKLDVNSIKEEYSLSDAREQSLEIILKRIELLGIQSPKIELNNDNRIIIKLPEVKDLERVKSLLERNKPLKLYLVLAQAMSMEQLQPVDKENEMVLIQQNNNVGAPLLYTKLDKHDKLLTSKLIRKARTDSDPFGTPTVIFEFDSEGTELFSQLTGENIGNQLAIVKDEKIFSTPVIPKRMTRGKVSINANFSLQEAEDLAIILQAGVMPAKLIHLATQSAESTK